MASPAVDLVQAAELVAELCRRFEGFRARPYLCPAGVPTIGYGATAYLDGRAVRLDDPPLSREAADRLLLGQILRVYLPGTQALCPGLGSRALAAVADFAFNLGLARLKASTLRRRLLAGDLAGAVVEMRRWNRSGGRVLLGLVLRREAEVALLCQRSPERDGVAFGSVVELGLHPRPVNAPGADGSDTRRPNAVLARGAA